MTELEQLRSEIDRVDKELAALFCRRMELVKKIADVKEAAGLPICDPAREAELANNGAKAFPDAAFLPYYGSVQNALLDASRAYQAARREGKQ